MRKIKNDIKRLEDKWNKILDDSGFVDIEETKGKDRVLKQIANHAYWRSGKLAVKSKFEYYNSISQKVQIEKFDCGIDKLILVMASQGMSHASIVRILSSIGKRRYRATIRFIIRRYEMKWGLKSWTLKQMNLKYPMPIKL